MKEVIKNIIKALCYSMLAIAIIVISILGCSRCARATDLGPFGVTKYDYSDSLNHIRDALLVQSGAIALQNGTLRYLRKNYADRYPWTKEVGVIGLAGYSIYRTKHVAFAVSSSSSLDFYRYGSGVTIHF